MDELTRRPPTRTEICEWCRCPHEPRTVHVAVYDDGCEVRRVVETTIGRTVRPEGWERNG